MKYIGMKASSRIAGAFRPAAADTTKPRLAASEYAGAVEAMPTTTLPSRPSAPDFRPLLSTVLAGGPPPTGSSLRS
jgi:hypothetical protein